MRERKKTKETEAFRKACIEMADAVNAQIFEGYRTPYWIGGEVGDLCDFEDVDFLTPSDMVLILEHHLSYDEYAEWRNATLDNPELPHINLHSWIMGARYNTTD